MEIADFKLEHYFERYEFSAPFLLSCSDAESMTLPELLSLADEEMREAWERLWLGYTEVPGHPLLREEIARLYERVEPDDVLVFAGAEEPIFAALNVCLQPGDRAVVVTPAYQSLYEVGRAVGARVELLPLRERDGWRLDVDRLQDLVRPETRLIVVNAPNSPTGSIPDRAAFDAVFDAARAVGARVLLDEVYRFMEFDPADRLPAGADHDERAMSLGVMSKSFGLAGLRIGWIATRDPGLRRSLMSFKHYLTICSSAPSEILATIALRARERILERNRAIVAGNLVHLDRFFEEWAGTFDWVRPRGGTVAFPHLAADVDITGFAEALVAEEGVVIVPGSVFDDTQNHFRVGFGRTDLPEALARLDRFAKRTLRDGSRR